MGLNKNSVGHNATKSIVLRQGENDRVIALAGNPNVGKSTVFNALTGMNQHTGNWPGKTIACTTGRCKGEFSDYVLVDIPGTYSLLAHSKEEEIARGYICFGNPDATVVVCDATCLERNLNLVLQILEISKNTIVCVNLMDEAARKNISININALSQSLGVPVVGISARKKDDSKKIIEKLDEFFSTERLSSPFRVRYSDAIENAIEQLVPLLEPITEGKISNRWLALRLIASDEQSINECTKFLSKDIVGNENISLELSKIKSEFLSQGLDREKIEDLVISSIITAAEQIAKSATKITDKGYNYSDRRIDKFLTGRLIGYPVMLLFLGIIFWITISGANYPSELLNNLFGLIESKIDALLINISAPEWLRGMLVDGMFRVLFWVVAVMLPPMAIFFPLFTLLEDIGYLPRIAYNLDKPFKKCKACGKQALTMCMGFGCNAAGIVGCRIIDSPRERMLAILTNSFVPCNGRLPQQSYGKKILSLCSNSLAMFLTSVSSISPSKTLSSIISLKISPARAEISEVSNSPKHILTSPILFLGILYHLKILYAKIDEKTPSRSSGVFSYIERD